jgi:cephalosporin hydroxylase
MRKHVLALTITAALLACGVISASAQSPNAETGNEDGFLRHHPGMMGMMGDRMIGHDYGYRDCDRERGMVGPVMARIIFSLMDADGDGKLTLQEFQAAHERIFKAMDADHDGTVTLEEMQAFMRGVSRPASPQ